MKIVILCKRRPQQKDLWERPYGRFYYLAKHLAEFDNEVHLVLLNYRTEEEFREERDGITWHSINLFPNPFRFYIAAKRLAKQIEADWIVGFSDTYYGIAAQVMGKSLGIRSLIDAYDNYESYLPYALPLHWFWRRSLKQCDALTAAGPQLLELMCQERSKKTAMVVEMCADPAFTPGSKVHARKALGLQPTGPIVAYSGSLHKSRGVAELFELIELLGESRPDIEWAISGRVGADVKLPENTHHLGYLNDNKVVEVLRAANATVCVNKPDKFGNFSYPVKVYEALATSTPVVAFSTDSVDFTLRSCDELIAPYGDLNSMADKIKRIIDNPPTLPQPDENWKDKAKTLAIQMTLWSTNGLVANR